MGNVIKCVLKNRMNRLCNNVMGFLGYERDRAVLGKEKHARKVRQKKSERSLYTLYII